MLIDAKTNAAVRGVRFDADRVGVAQIFWQQSKSYLNLDLSD